MGDVYLIPPRVNELLYEAAISKLCGNDKAAARLEAEARQYIRDNPKQCGKITNVADAEGGE